MNENLGRLIRFTTPNAHKRIFLYGDLVNGPWSESSSGVENYTERIITRDETGIIIGEYFCRRFDTPFYGVFTQKGDIGWVHYKNVEFICDP